MPSFLVGSSTQRGRKGGPRGVWAATDRAVSLHGAGAEDGGWVMVLSSPAFLPRSAILIGKLQSAIKGWWNCAQWMRKCWARLSPSLQKYANPHQTRKTLISFMELPSMAPSFPGKITSEEHLPVSQICDIRKISRETRWWPGGISVHVEFAYLLICTSKEVENSQTFRRLSPCTMRRPILSATCLFKAVFDWVLFAGILFSP